MTPEQAQIAALTAYVEFATVSINATSPAAAALFKLVAIVCIIAVFSER